MNRRPLFFLVLLVSCWLPLLTMSIAVCIEALAITGKPTQYVARGKVVVGTKIEPSPDAEEAFAEHANAQIEILECAEMKRRSLSRVRGLHPELKEIEVDVHASHIKGSSIVKVSASGAEQKYTRVYLDALLDEYQAFRQEIVAAKKDKVSPAFPDESIVVMERPTSATPAPPELFWPITIAAVIGGGAGLAVILLAAGVIARLAGKPRLAEVPAT